MYKCKFFKLYELLPPSVYKNENEGWELLDERLLRTIDTIREIMGVPLVANTWKQGGTFSQRGFREQNSKTGALRSQHKLGRALDMVSNKLSAEEMREIIKKNAARLPYNIRIENGVSWLHVDVKEGNSQKIYFFNA